MQGLKKDSKQGEICVKKKAQSVQEKEHGEHLAGVLRIESYRMLLVRKGYKISLTLFVVIFEIASFKLIPRIFSSIFTNESK